MVFRIDVWQLLRRNISKGQLLGYAIANIVGLSVVLIGILFFVDSKQSGDEDAFFSSDYVVLSKKVEGFGFAPITFSNEEIAELKDQKWVKKVGEFTSSQFAVAGSVNMRGKGLSTYLFFESVPDEFFDIKPDRWNFDPSKRFVPIIINKDYLTLYNYGFAMPQHLPHVSEEIISAIPIDLVLTGGMQEPQSYRASVVGFSSRLNTIAVPQSFMDWANEHFAPGIETQPSRLIVEVDRMNAGAMNNYLKDRGIEIAGDQQDAGNISSLLAVVSSVVSINGLVICALALFILMLSIFLMLQKSRTTLRNLMLLGYSPSDVASYYNVVIICANVIIAVAALAVALIARSAWSERLQEIGLGAGSLSPVFLVLLAYLVIVTIIDLAIIRTHLNKL